MKLGLQFRHRLEAAQTPHEASSATLEEMMSLTSALAAWGNSEHDDDGGHTDVTARTLLLETVHQAALKVVSGWTDVGGAAAYSGAITPDEITTATLEDYSPPGIDGAFLLRLSASVPVAIGGIQDGARLVPLSGRLLALFNAGSVDISLTHEEVASQENFRFRLPGFLNIHIPPNNFALLYYDGTSRRWVLLSSSPATGGVASSEYNAGNSGTNITVNWSNATQQIITLTNNATIDLIHGVEGQEYRLILIEGGGGGFTPSFTSPQGPVFFENSSLTTAAKAAGEILQVDIYFSLHGGGQYFATYTPWEVALGLDAGDLTLVDDTTNNVTSSAHGFAPKSPGDPETFLNGDVTPDYTVPRRELQYSDGSVPGGNTVANTTTETAFGSTYTIPANDLAVGDVLRIVARGTLGTDAAVAPTLRLKMYAGSAVLLDTTALTLPTSAASWGWMMEIDVIVTSLGVTGTVESQGEVKLPATATTSTVSTLANTAAVTVNTTTTEALTLKVTWGTADTDDTITLRTFSVERLRAA